MIKFLLSPEQTHKTTKAQVTVQSFCTDTCDCDCDSGDGDYDSGFDDGYEEGHSNGYEKGFKEGFKEASAGKTAQAEAKQEDKTTVDRIHEKLEIMKILHAMAEQKEQREKQAKAQVEKPAVRQLKKVEIIFDPVTRTFTEK